MVIALIKITYNKSVHLNYTVKNDKNQVAQQGKYIKMLITARHNNTLVSFQKENRNEGVRLRSQKKTHKMIFTICAFQILNIMQIM